MSQIEPRLGLKPCLNLLQLKLNSYQVQWDTALHCWNTPLEEASFGSELVSRPAEAIALSRYNVKR